MDTNVLVRYLAQDDPTQSSIATQWIEGLTQEKPGYISLVTLVELAWVLIGCYDVNRQNLSKTIQTILRTQELCVDRSETAWKAVRLFEKSKADFADCLIVELAKEAGCESTVSFDSAAVKTAGMKLLT